MHLDKKSRETRSTIFRVSFWSFKCYYSVRITFIQNQKLIIQKWFWNSEKCLKKILEALLLKTTDEYSAGMNVGHKYDSSNSTHVIEIWLSWFSIFYFRKKITFYLQHSNSSIEAMCWIPRSKRSTETDFKWTSTKFVQLGSVHRMR